MLLFDIEKVNVNHLVVDGHKLTKFTTKKLIESLNDLYEYDFNNRSIYTLESKMKLKTIKKRDSIGNLMAIKHVILLPDGNEIQLEPTEKGGYFF